MALKKHKKISHFSLSSKVCVASNVE